MTVSVWGGIYCDDCVCVWGGFTVMNVSLCVWGIYCDDCVGDLL